MIIINIGNANIFKNDIINKYIVNLNFKIIKSSEKNPGFIKKSYSYLSDEITMLKNIGKVFYDKNRTHAIRKLILSISENGMFAPAYNAL